MDSPAVTELMEKPRPLPKSVARELSGLQRLMRSHYIGVIVMVVCLSSLAIQPLCAVAPVFLLSAWLGVFKIRSMQRFFDITSGLFIAIFMLILEGLFGVRIRTFGHMEQYKPRSVFVMNHICHFDWLYFWGVVERNGDITCWKAITKNMIRKVPLIGLLMQYMCHMFITRHWPEDEKEFRKKLFYYNALDLPVQLLLFPEGGDLTAHSKARSNSYADQNGFPRYNYCLHPRAKGFLYIMKALRSGHLDAVYDVTVGYPDALAKTEADFLKGECMPREIHYCVRHYKAEDLPTDDEELTKWLYKRWREKEKTLELFYTHKRFMEPVSKETDKNSTILADTTQQNGHTEYKPVREVIRRKSYMFSFSGLAFYMFLMVTFTYLMLVSWVWCGCVVVMSAYTLRKGLTTGIDTVLPDKIHKRVKAAYLKCYGRGDTNDTHPVENGSL